MQDRDLKSKYEGVTDEELILRLHEGEEGVTEYILNKYKNLVRSKAKSMYILGADSEDLIQEGMIGLFKAMRDYDYGRDASFLTFADLCISRQMYTAVTASGRKKHMPLNTYISLSSKDDSNDEESGRFSLEETLVFDSDNPERIVIDRENVEDIEHFIDTELSSFEKEVLDLYLTGMSYTSIAKVLSKDEKSTDNALQRAKSKLKKKLSK
ncbi:MAG: RNA polymerase sporulation sigma factor SigH [Lachnospiraceae bacterium]|nr:RNA polymerase sporulation sigma factor SigH [Lachnospiraceae bacterium]